MTPPLPDGVWPEDELEHLNQCPVCRSADRTMLLDGLVDDSFRVAAGQWSLWRCNACTNGYLDPRPNRASIGKAYSSYYTHDQAPAGSVPRSRLARLRNALGNGYRNRRFGTHLKPAIGLGYWVTRLLPGMKSGVDAIYRFLPKRAVGRDQRLFDFGCGNGDWLALARDAGWDVRGLEPDPASAALARKRGIRVSETLDELAREHNAIDWITMNHVVEHLHDPVATLKTLAGMLKPGGGLYLETPNLDALGRTLYGRHWRGLEAPRHLVLFTAQGLTNVLRDAGFEDIRLHPQLRIWKGMSVQSERMSRGALPEDPSVSASGEKYGVAERLRQRLDRNRTEFITLTCERPL